MKLNHRIKIDLLEVFRSGKFDFIKPGRTREWILNNFPDPDEYESGATLHTAQFWRYGNIDFFFYEDCLTQIFTDDIDSLDGGKNIEIRKWVLEGPKALSVHFVVQNLVRERINFQIRHDQREYISQTSVGLINSCVHLTFQPVESATSDIKLIDPNAYELCSITIMERGDFETAYNPRQ